MIANHSVANRFTAIIKEETVQRPLFLILAFVLAFSLDVSAAQSAQETPEPALLTDPFLQLPTEDAVRVVWFTEFEGAEHFVLYGEDLETPRRRPDHQVEPRG